ncbi:MAG: aminodeoxychorismate synthase component I [Cellvibrionaceae bacterium]
MPEIIPLRYEPDTESVFSKLRGLPYACWLDSGKPKSNYGRYDIISAAPALRLVTKNQTTEIRKYQHGSNTVELCKISNADPLALLQKELQKLEINTDTPEPFSGGAIGYFGYDLSRRYIRLTNPPVHTEDPSDLPPFADMQVGIYHWALIQDHQLKTAWITTLPECDPKLLRDIKSRLDNRSPMTASPPFHTKTLTPVINKTHYIEQLERIHDYILAGDCYQVNFAQCFQGQYTGDPYSAYKQLRQQMASPFSAYLQLDSQTIMSLSPERFLHVQGDKVLTQPIKGTAPRDNNYKKDQKRANQLYNDDKNRAENLMIVDLLRNDLGQHCIPGSIKVDELFGLQSFPNVHHLVSSITGQLIEGSHSLDLLRDCFPGGSITGAPKKRAMEIIDELETGQRGVYCGSIGYINHNGDMDTNIAIRTVSCDDETLYCWGGGGIVADSKANEEYQESLDKIGTILENLRNIIN